MLMRAGNAGDAAAYRRLLMQLTPALRAFASRGLARAGAVRGRRRGRRAGDAAGAASQAPDLGRDRAAQPMAVRHRAPQADRRPAPPRPPRSRSRSTISPKFCRAASDAGSSVVADVSRHLDEPSGRAAQCRALHRRRRRLDRRGRRAAVDEQRRRPRRVASRPRRARRQVSKLRVMNTNELIAAISNDSIDAAGAGAGADARADPGPRHRRSACSVATLGLRPHFLVAARPSRAFCSSCC